MEWLKVWRSLFSHRKTVRLAALLNVRDSDLLCAKLIRLWCWCQDNAPDGNLSELTPREIATAANWSRNASDFVAKLVAVGYLDADHDGLYIHNWHKRGGKQLASAATHAADMRVYRAIKRDSHVQVTCESRDTTEKNREEQIKEEKKERPAAKPIKKKYGELQNVTLSDDEYQKLLSLFGETDTAARIERLALYKGSTGKKYASDYFTILSWSKKDADKPGGNGKNSKEADAALLAWKNSPAGKVAQG